MATGSGPAAMSSSWRPMSSVSTPRRRWVGATPTMVTPAAGTSAPPGRVRSMVKVPVPPTHSSPSSAPMLRSGSQSEASSSTTWADGSGSPKPRQTGSMNASSSSGRGTR